MVNYKLFTYSTLSLLIAYAAFLGGCAKDRSDTNDVNNPALYGYNGYNNYYGGYNGGLGPNGVVGANVLAAQARVVSDGTYRKFLQGDFCDVVFNNTCNGVDGAPVVELALQSLEIPAGGVVQGTISIRLNRNYNGLIYYNNNLTSSQWQRQISIRYVNNNTAFEGQAIDYRTPTGFKLPVFVRGTGNPSNNPVRIDIYYGNDRMLTADLYRVR